MTVFRGVHAGWCCLWIASGLMTLVSSSPLDTHTDRHVFPVSVTTMTPRVSTSCQQLPDLLQVDIAASDPFPQSLVLYRKDVFVTDVPVYVIKRGGSGDRVFYYTERVEIDEEEKDTAYENQEFGAAFLVHCTANGRFTIGGSIHVEGRKYRVRHLSDVTPSWEMTSWYEFAYVNGTFHNDGILQGKGRGDRRSEAHSPGPVSHTARAAREKRDTTQYYIDVLVALDYAFYKYWLTKAGNSPTEAIKQAKQYVAYIFNEINSRYASIDTTDYRLNVILSGFIIAQTANESPWTENVKEQTANSGVFQVKADTVLTQLESYVSDNINSLPAHDHLMLITEYDLYGDDNGFRFNNTAGFAYVGSMCHQDGRSVSVVEDHGGFQSETTATHELGHSLGSKHDGEQNNCSSDERYIMSGGVHPETPTNKLNPWHFSSCSVNAFTQYIESLETTNCLTGRISQSGVPTVTGKPGQLSGPDEQCRQIYGSGSFLCRGTKFGAPENICLSMFCRNPATASTCTLFTAATGTCCGYKKWCIQGECVPAPETTCYTSATCPFGQRKGVIFRDLTCDQLHGGYCYNTNFRMVCCEMCDRKFTSNPGCEYGDKVAQCNASFCGQTLPQSQELYDVQCCGTCARGTTLTTPTPGTTTTTSYEDDPEDLDICKDSILVNGREKCDVFITRSGLGQCCKIIMQTFCCASCEARRNVSDPTCPYGDCAICTSLRSQRNPCSDDQRNNCCRTCQELDRKLPANTTPASPRTSTPTSFGPSTTTPTTPAGLVSTMVVVTAVVVTVVCGWW
ncbi:A disintegrin and metalloproteinase with thrombospondin motifs like [Babylonia areolata]|uniref:A disintegrin and metalloproteinase with thrombospondin motifs like n=1 Tax=Babylonia areolata TaxID=304850 RepID=UPI003FD530BA